MSFYDNAFSAQHEKEKALDRARAELASQGITFPIRTNTMSAIDYYDATREYSAKEATLVANYLKKIAQPRPLAFDNVEKKETKKPFSQKWNQPYYD